MSLILTKKGLSVANFTTATQSYCLVYPFWPSTLPSTFQVFPIDHISYNEFVSMIRSYNVKLTDNQMYDFMQTLDKDKNGFIDFSV